MKVLVDHSIAHPNILARNMREVYERHSMISPYSINDPFWEQVTTDLEEADIILANSEYVRDSLVESGIDSHKIRVRYLGVRSDFSNFNQDYYYDPKKPFRILFTGTFGLRKGADLLIKLVRSLKFKGISAEIHVAGEASEGMELLKSSPNLQGNFKFYGFMPQEELARLFRVADLYVFPSYVEGSAKSVMEAMSAGLPVVCTYETGSPIVNGQSGLLTSRGDVGELVEAVTRMYEAHSLRESCGRAAAKVVSERYTWGNYGHELKALYQEMLS